MLLLTPTLMLALSFLIVNKDVKVSIRYWVSVYLLDILMWQFLGHTLFYFRAAFTDMLMFATVFMLKDDMKALAFGIVCSMSLILNIVEWFSYYQTWYYPYRYFIQLILTQLLCIILLMGCQWRDLCKKTHTQK